MKDSIRLEMVGGPLDGEIIHVSPMMNSRFFIERNGRKEWYQTFGGGKAHYDTKKEKARWV